MVHFEEKFCVVLAPSIGACLVDLVMRKNSEDKRVMGILMGTKDDFGGDIRVRSCHPAEFRQGSVEGCRTSIELHKCVYPKDQPIGFFCVSFEIASNKEELKNFRNLYMKEISSSAIELQMIISEGSPVEISCKSYSLSSQPDGKENLSVNQSGIQVECSLAEYNLCKLLFNELTEEDSYVEGNVRLASEEIGINCDESSVQDLDKLSRIACSILDGIPEQENSST